ncbi:MAG: hypothetical protein U9Q23_05740 [Candidatus Bipolaricaulota bacterium]|nr:hypothetical protein [Candidatus Bipolaricaulota bacterium]
MHDEKIDIQLAITGAAGEGIQTVGDIISRTILSHGYPVLTGKEYESRIRIGNEPHRPPAKGWISCGRNSEFEL